MQQIAEAQKLHRDTEEIVEFAELRSERVAVVIIDRFKYTPQNQQVITQLDVPQQVIAQIANDAYTYIQQHPEEVGEATGNIAKIILI